MITVGYLFLLLIIGGVLYTVARRWRVRDVPRVRVEHSFLTRHSISWKGSAVVGLRSTAAPLGALTVDRDYARIHGLGLGAPVWIARESIDKVEVRRILNGSRIRFHAADGRYDGVAVYLQAGTDPRSALTGLGWPVAG